MTLQRPRKTLHPKPKPQKVRLRVTPKLTEQEVKRLLDDASADLRSVRAHVAELVERPLRKRGGLSARIPSIVWASVMLTMVMVILGEEMFGEHAAPELAIVLLANAFCGLFPLFVLYRMITRSHPFTTAAPLEADTAAGRSLS